MLVEDDQFCEYSKTSLRICGTKAVCPFECFEVSCALNMGFVMGAINLDEEDIGVVDVVEELKEFHVNRGNKKSGWVSRRALTTAQASRPNAQATQVESRH